MNSETKMFLGIILATVLLIGGAAFAFSRPTAEPKVDTNLLIKEDSHKTGSPSASVTMVEFGDFQCPACGAYHTVVTEMMKKFEGKLALVFRQFPLSSHKNAMPAALAAEAAGKQGKFWEMYDKLYVTQSEWSADANVRERFSGYAKELGLNTGTFDADMDAAELKKRVEQDIVDATALGVNATPTFYLNGKKIQNPRSSAEFAALIQSEIDKSPTPTATAETGAFHIHANLRMVLNGKAVDFSLPRYQSKDGEELNEFIHFHDGVGSSFHVHKRGMLLRDLFSSLNMSVTKDCLVTDDRTRYCPAGDKTLKMYVNGQPESGFDAYEPKDLDRILITYGNENAAALDAQIKSVPDDACIYSEKCPERGTPPSEECVGGLGTDCE